MGDCVRNEARIAYERAWKIANAEKVRAYKSAYRERLRAQGKNPVGEWHQANPEMMRSYRARWRDANRDAVAELSRDWNSRNPERRRAAWQRRQAAKLQRMPPWFGEFDELVMLEAHDVARRRRGEWDVDHIVPLQGSIVSGLHVWNNIQVVPAAFNRSKGNRWKPS